MNVSKSLSDADIEFVIEEIKKRPHLWDPACNDYKNENKAAKSWVEISELMNNEEQIFSIIFD